MAAACSPRPMSAADLAQVAAIEEENPSPWSLAQLADELARDGGWQFVAVAAGRPGPVCGFVCGRLVAGEAELFRIAVRQKDRRRGIASLLLAHSIDYLAARGGQRLFLELRSANRAAKALYEKAGFRQVGMRRNYYASPPDHALIMEKVIGESVA
ncbi:ribosomal protein S18-alanine N-acetyltransferase [Thiovibrio sp. JS02]